MFIEAKASQAAADKMKKTQIQLQDELMKSGGIVKGRDRANLFPGGTKLPPLPRQMKIKPQEAGQ